MRDLIHIGPHAVEEALKHAESGSTLYVQRSARKKYYHLIKVAESCGVEVRIAPDSREIDQVYARSTGQRYRKPVAADSGAKSVESDHRGIMLRSPGYSDTSQRGGAESLGSFSGTVVFTEELKRLEQLDRGVVLILDGITDPQNFGAILRSADMFSVDLVITPVRRSVQLNPTVVKVSSGAAQYVRVATVTNLVRAIQQLQEIGFWVYGADMGGDSLLSTTFNPKSAIVMGSEGDGIGRLVRESCDHMVSIPTKGHIDSLNVSVATGILLFETFRQR